MGSRVILCFGILSLMSFPSLANNNLKHIVDLTKNIESQIDDQSSNQAVALESKKEIIRGPASVGNRKSSRSPASVAGPSKSKKTISKSKKQPSRMPASFGKPKKVSY